MELEVALGYRRGRIEGISLLIIASIAVNHTILRRTRGTGWGNEKTDG